MGIIIEVPCVTVTCSTCPVGQLLSPERYADIGELLTKYLTTEAFREECIREEQARLLTVDLAIVRHDRDITVPDLLAEAMPHGFGPTLFRDGFDLVAQHPQLVGYEYLVTTHKPWNGGTVTGDRKSLLGFNVRNGGLPDVGMWIHASPWPAKTPCATRFLLRRI